MKNKNDDSALFGVNSIKFKIKLAFFMILAISAALIFISVYSFEAYFKQVYDYSSSYYEVLNIKNSFDSMNKSIEDYWKNGSEDNLTEFNVQKNQISQSIEKMQSDNIYLRDDEQHALLHSISQSYEIYIGNMNHLALSADKTASLTEYYNTYQSDSEYIDSYINQLLNMSFTKSESYYKNFKEKMTVSFIIQGSALIAILVMISYIIYSIIRHIVQPVLQISAQSKEIALGNFEVEDIALPKQKHKNEISNLIFMFNHMKNSLKNMFETSAQNLKMAQELIDEQKKYETVAKELSSEKRQNEILFQKANYDNLTNIFNRNAFENNVRQTIDIFTENSLGALFVIDVDNFKSVNDTLGHQGGDEVLKSLAYSLSNVLADCGFAGRWGGDEFVGFISDAPNLHFIHQKAANLCQIMNKQFIFRGMIHHISISVGVCPVFMGDDLKKVYEHADEVLYDVKEHGRNNFKIYMEKSIVGKEY